MCKKKCNKALKYFHDYNQTFTKKQISVLNNPQGVDILLNK